MAKTRYTLNNLRPDVDYKLQLRAKVKGITGAWSSVLEFTTTLDETPPGPVQNLALAYTNNQFVLSWDPPADVVDGSTTDLERYRIYVTDLTDNNEQTFDADGSPVEFTLDFMRWLFDDQGAPGIDALSGQWRFEVAALDRSGNESTRASVEFTAEPPGPFNMLAWVGGNQTITITWEASVDVDLDHYKIYRDGVLVGRTLGLELEFLDANPGPGVHSYYAVAYDALGLFTQSTNSITDAKTYGYWQGDVSVPRPPSGLAFDSVIAGAGVADVTVYFDAPVQNMDDSDYEDHSEFLVQWSQSLDGPWQSARVLDDRVSGTDLQQFEVGINGLQASTAWHFRVQTIDRYSNKSAWANGSHTTVSDTTAPSRPAVPTAAANLLRVQVTHDLTKEAGGELEADVRALKVYISTSSGFTPGPANYIGTLDIPGLEGFVATGSFPVSSVLQRWVKVTAVDATGNESLASTAADAGAIQLINDLYVENAGITTASIGSLSVSKLVAGDGVVNSFDIKALLRILNGGYLESENFNNNPVNGPLAGYRLSEGGLEVYSGTVAASALTINNSPNLVPWAYSSFEHTQSYFFGGTDAGGNAIPAKLIFTANANTSQIVADAWEGERSLRFRSAVGTTGGSPAELLFTASTSVYQIPVEAGNKYLVSFYSKSTTSYAVTLVARWGGSATTETTAAITIPAASGVWRRNYAIFTAPSGATGMYIGLRTSSPSVDFNLDAFQVELTQNLADSLLAPSAWRVPGMTSIDGTQITTGEIKSTNYNGTNTGWRIGLEGNLTAYNAFFHGNVQATGGFLQTLDVRGTITVGSVSNGLITDYLSRFYLRSSDGLLYASNANISGTINAVAGNFQGVTATDITVGQGTGLSGTIKSWNWSGMGGNGWIISNTNISGYQAIFNDVYVRGDIVADNLTGTFSVSGNNITGGTITGTTIQTNSNSTGYVVVGNSGSGHITYHNSNGGNNPTWGIYQSLSGFGGTSRNGIRLGNIQADYAHISSYLYVDGNFGALGSLSGSSLSVSALTTGGTYIEASKALNMNNNSINNVAVLYAQSGTVYGGAIYGGSSNQAKLGNAPAAATDAWVGGTSSGFKFASSECRALEETGTSYVPVRASSFPVGSSIKFKKDVKDIKHGLEVVRKMRPKTYNHKHIPTSRLNAGFIAEDLAELNDRLVMDDKEAVDTYAILAYAIRALQELDAKLNKLEGLD